MTTIKNPALAHKKLSALLRRLGGGSPAKDMPPHADPVATLVMSMLLWESTTDKALAGYERLVREVVDFNDLRVCMPHETADLLGPRNTTPRSSERRDTTWGKYVKGDTTGAEKGQDERVSTTGN